jgi:hypothetical protein
MAWGRKVLLATLLAIGGSAAAQETAMTNAELTALLTGGKTINLGGPGHGYKGELSLNADGTGAGKATTDGGDVITIVGTWRIEGDQFCRTWKGFGDGEVCETWVRDGDDTVRVLVDGEPVGVNHW